MDNISIHPGVRNGRRVHALSKTSKPVNGKVTGKLAWKQKVLNVRQIACVASQKADKKSNGIGYTMPGSMKG